MLEIGICKVQGAGAWNVVKLLLIKFSWPVLMANLVTWPPTYFYLECWLTDFFYRVDLNLSYFLCAGLLSLFIVWSVGAIHAIRVALRNPIHALQAE